MLEGNKYMEKWESKATVRGIRNGQEVVRAFKC